ncbi:MAG: hypothetical protein JSU00_04390 [Acidobacteria bacterium]|nr:hypothetical protein [Acidobacteriota bacterium]
MPTQATARNHPALDPAPDPHLRFYMTRDEFMRNLLPATQEEKLLATRAARAWMHLEDIEALIDAVTEGRGLFSLYTDHYDRYKQLNRDLHQADAMWSRAMNAFHRARKRNGAAVGRPCRHDDIGVLVPSHRPGVREALDPQPAPAAESPAPPQPAAPRPPSAPTPERRHPREASPSVSYNEKASPEQKRE